MERIINSNGNGEWSITSSDYYKAFERLAAIEDVLGDDYDLDRLATIMNQRMSMREDVAVRWKLTSDIPLDRLRELAQADRDGRCVVLPCKCGDKVYISTKTGVIEREIAKIEIMHDIEFHAVDFIRGEIGIYFFTEDVGKTVFLTCEQAEAKLKEREKE